MKNKIHLLEPFFSDFNDISFKDFYKLKLQDKNYHQNFFEKKLEEYLDSDKRVCLLSSGTAAIHLSLVISNVSKKDVVFCSNSTFIATVNPILYMQAEPYFIDIDLNTGNMNLNYLEEAIKETMDLGKNAKAIIITHSYGVPADMEKLNEIKEKYGLVLIEDAAEALGAKFQGEYCGTIGDIGVLSFNTNKINTTLGGGAIIVKNEVIKKAIIKYSTHYKGESFDFKHSKLGYNYRMNDFAAYVGYLQIMKIENELKRKKEIHFQYTNFLNDRIMKFNNSNIEPNYWLNCLKISPFTFTKVFLELNNNNIEIRRVWYPLNKQKYLQDYKCFGNGESLNFYESVICVPSTSSLSTSEVKRISSIVNNLDDE